MNVNVEMGIGAVLKLVVRKADTDEIVRETPEFCNLVLTTGLARMAVGTWIDRCCVGTGNGTPVASQVALDSFLASTTSTAEGQSDAGGIQVTKEPYYWFGRRTWRFAVGMATGNISEVGLGWGNSNLWNKALVKDTAGNPTSITVLADEYLDVISEVRVYPGPQKTSSFNVVDKNGNVLSTHFVIIRPRFSSYGSGGAGWLSGKIQYALGGSQNFNVFGIGNEIIPELPTGQVRTKFETGSLVQEALPNGLKASKVITSSEANFEGNHVSFTSALEGLMCGGYSGSLGQLSCGYNWEVRPAIPKDAETILTYSFTLNWSNYAP